MDFFVGRNIIEIFFLVGAVVAISDLQKLWGTRRRGIMKLFKALPLGFPLVLFAHPSALRKYIITNQPSNLNKAIFSSLHLSYPCNKKCSMWFKMRTYNRLVWTSCITITWSTKSSTSSSSTNAQTTQSSIWVSPLLHRESALPTGFGTWGAACAQPELLKNIRLALQERNAARDMHPLHAWLRL